MAVVLHIHIDREQKYLYSILSLCSMAWLATSSKEGKQHGFLSHTLKQALSIVLLLFSEMKTFHRIPCRETSTQPEFAAVEI